MENVVWSSCDGNGGGMETDRFQDEPQEGRSLFRMYQGSFPHHPQFRLQELRLRGLQGLNEGLLPARTSISSQATDG